MRIYDPDLVEGRSDGGGNGHGDGAGWGFGNGADSGSGGNRGSGGDGSGLGSEGKKVTLVMLASSETSVVLPYDAPLPRLKPVT